MSAPRPGGWGMSSRNLFLTAGYEFLDAMRSRRALVLFLLYFAGSVVACNMFVEVMRQVEKEVLQTLQLSSTDAVGSVTQTIWETDLFRNMVHGMVHDRQLADHLVNTPPMALFYGWLSFTFAPLFIMLMASTRIAEELGSGSARFVLFRSSLFSWCLGKYLGQALVLFPALLLSGLGAWLTGYFRLSFFDPLESAIYLGGYSVKAMVYTWSFLGLAMGVSQLTRYPSLATVLGFLGMVALTIAGAAAAYYGGAGWKQCWDLLLWLTPKGHRLDLWWPALSHSLPATFMLLVLGLLYLLPGYAVLRRRDY